MEPAFPTEVWCHILGYVLRRPVDVCSIAPVCKLFSGIVNDALERLCRDHMHDHGLRLTMDAPLVESLRLWAAFRKREAAFIASVTAMGYHTREGAGTSYMVHKQNVVKLHGCLTHGDDVWSAVVGRIWDVARTANQSQAVMHINHASKATELYDYAISFLHSLHGSRAIPQTAVLDTFNDPETTRTFIFRARHYKMSYFVLPRRKFPRGLNNNIDSVLLYRPYSRCAENALADGPYHKLARAISDGFSDQEAAIFVGEEGMFLLYLGAISPKTTNVYSARKLE